MIGNKKMILVAKYKAMLQEIIDKQPAGLRKRLAVALGVHKSFVSHITNPAYRVPIPASTLQIIFDTCKFSTKERDLFVSLYKKAHGSNIELSILDQRVGTQIQISLPALNNPSLTTAINKMIHDFSERLIAMARSIDTASEYDPFHGNEHGHTALTLPPESGPAVNLESGPGGRYDEANEASFYAGVQGTSSSPSF